jgi:hypothetical protein
MSKVGRRLQNLLMIFDTMLVLPFLVRGLRKFAQLWHLCSRSDLLNTMSIGPTAVEVFAGT